MDELEKREKKELKSQWGTKGVETSCSGKKKNPTKTLRYAVARSSSSKKE